MWGRLVISDVLAIGAHPDDVELTVGAAVALLARQGYRVAIADLTRARLSTRGDEATRAAEAAEAAKILGVADRINLDLSEGSLLDDREPLHRLVSLIRETRPGLILAPYWEDRHPDHSDASRLIQRAYFWAGVSKFGDDQPPHRPKRVAYYFSHWETTPSFVVDVSETFELKMQSARAYRSQFELPPGEEANTFISRPDFLQRIVARAEYFGSRIGARYGEPFLVREMNRVEDVVRWAAEQGEVG